MLTGLVRHFAPRLGLMAEPVARSAHSRLTPTGGGLAMLPAYAICLGVLYSQGLLPLPALMALAAGLPLALLGLWDDVRHLPAGLRVACHSGAALWAMVWLGGGLPVLEVGGWRLENGWLLDGLTLLGLVWLLNLYNFMDGIDGLAGGEALFVNTAVPLFLVFCVAAGACVAAAGAGVAAPGTGIGTALVWCHAVLAAAAAGFLWWNRPPARLFMGDVGSGLLGFALGVLALISIRHGLMNLWAWLLLLGVFAVDASVTLIRRMLGGSRWYESHASHAYQHAARRWSHGRVTAAAALINLLWLAPLAWLALSRPPWAPAVAAVGLAPLLGLAFYLRAGVSSPSP